MKASLILLLGSKHRTRRAAALGLFLTLFATSSAFAIGTPEQRRACTPDAITACLRRQKASLSEACRAYFEQ